MHHRYETAVYEAVRGRGGSWRSCSAHSQRRGRSLGRERYSWGDTRRRRHPDGGRDEASSLFINVGRRGCAAGSFRHYYESARKPLSLLLPFPLRERERERSIEISVDRQLGRNRGRSKQSVSCRFSNRGIARVVIWWIFLSRGRKRLELNDIEWWNRARMMLNIIGVYFHRETVLFAQFFERFP